METVGNKYPISWLGAIIISCLGYSLGAQERIFPSDELNKVQLELNYKPVELMRLPVKEIEILDARFDQTIVGSTTGEFILEDNLYSKKDIVLSIAFSDYMQQRIMSWFVFNRGSDDERLIILVKKFRTNENVARMLLKNQKKEVLFLLSASFYLQKNDKCYKIGAVDNWFSSDHASQGSFRSKKNLHEWIVTNVLIAEIQKLSFDYPVGTPSYTRLELETAITQRLSLPVLKEATRRGIYRTFSEFLSNQPSDTSFALALNKKRDFVFVDSLRRKLNSSNSWGLSDGTKAVFMFGENFYELTRKDNSFRVLTYRKTGGDKTVSIIEDLYVFGLISKKTRRLFKNAAMPDHVDIDMETGELLLEEVVGPYKNKAVAELIRIR